MSGKKRCASKCVRGILVGLVIAAVVVAICYYSQSQPSFDGFSKLKELILPNKTRAEIQLLSSTSNDGLRLPIRTTAEQLSELNDLVETYKGALPEDVLKIVDNLVFDHLLMKNRTMS